MAKPTGRPTNVGSKQRVERRLCELCAALPDAWAVSALTVASASVTFEPARLHGRRFQADIDERTWRVGAAYTYLPSKNWSLSAHFDYDRVNSDDRFRSLRRQRVGLNVTYAL